MTPPTDPEATEVDGDGAGAPSRHPPEALVGTLFDGRFEIEGIIGQGGSGTVYRALQQSLARPVALKISWLDQDTRGDEATRFLREASLAGSLQHPNVVTVHDFGRTEDGACYMVMELLEGVSLRTVMGGEPMDTRRAISLFDQILGGLRHAHQAGLIHRDMKPGNVQVTRTDEGQERIKILDFGLVRRTRDEDQGLREGTFVGTPHYASPEQVRGIHADVRSDIYSVGVMLYRALTGCLPFVGPTPVAIASAQVRKAYPLMASRAPEVDVHPQLEAVVRKAMDKAPACRYPDARSMQLALREWARAHIQEPMLSTGAPETQSLEFESVGAPRQRGWVLGLGLLAIGVTVMAGWLNRESEDSRTGARLSVSQDLPVADVEDEVGDGGSVAQQNQAVRIRIQTEPPGAEVEFGGQIIGATPLETELSLRVSEDLRQRTFWLRLEGYEDAEMVLDLSMGSAAGNTQLIAKRSDVKLVERGEPAKDAALSAPSGAVYQADGVSFTANEASAVLRLANEASLAEFQALGIRTQEANAVIRAREYRSIGELGSAPRVGKKTLEKLLSAVQ